MAETPPVPNPTPRLNPVAPVLPEIPKVVTPKLVNPILPQAATSYKPSKLGSGTGATWHEWSAKKQGSAEAQDLGHRIVHAGPGLVDFLGGASVDVGKLLLSGVTLGHFHTGDKRKTKLAEFGEMFSKTAEFWNLPSEYYTALKNNKPISGLIIRDAGNVSIVGGIFLRGFNVASVSFAEAGVTASAEAAAAGGEASAAAAAGEEAAAAAAAGKAAAAAERATALNNLATKFQKYAERTHHVIEYPEKAMMLPLKPWIAGKNALGSAIRNGVYVEGIGGWGQRAVTGYTNKINDMLEQNPNISIDDPELTSLRKKLERANIIALSPVVRAIVHQAARSAEHDKELTTQSIENERVNPLYKEEINPATNEPWGELSQPENEAIISILNGRAQQIKVLADLLGLDPEEIALMGRFDMTHEYHLSPSGARMAYEYLTPESRTMSDQQYDRLSHATENVIKNVSRTSQLAIGGYGRKSRLTKAYLVPLPFANLLERNVMRYGSEELQQAWATAKENGILDLDLMHPDRVKFLMSVVEQLPDEAALDASMYPASMRENIEFYKRIRRALNRRVTGEATGEPIPPYDGGPRNPEEFKMTVGGGKLRAAEELLAKSKDVVERITNKLNEIYDKIAELEEKHQAMAAIDRKNQIVDEAIKGVSVKTLSRKYHLSVVEIENIISANPAGKLFRKSVDIQVRLTELEKVIGAKRASLGPAEADAELLAMQNEYAQLQAESAKAKAQAEAAAAVNKIAMQANANSLDKIVEEIAKLDDAAYEAGTELERAGGDALSVWREGDTTDPNIAFASADLGAAAIDEINALIDERLMHLQGADHELLFKVKDVLQSAWSKAQNDYLDATDNAVSNAAAARLSQMSEYLMSVVDKLNWVVLNPTDISLEEMTMKVVTDIVTNKTDQAILSGSAPVDMPIRRGTPGATPFQRPPRPAFEDFVWKDVIDKNGNIQFDKLFEDVRKFKLTPKSKAILTALVDTFADPTGIESPKFGTPYGDLGRLSEAASQMVRWLNDVMNARTLEERIDRILNKPDYMAEELYKKIMFGTTRIGWEMLEADASNHPLNKFKNKIEEYLHPVIRKIYEVESQYRNFDTVTQIEWNDIENARVNYAIDGRESTITLRFEHGWYRVPSTAELIFPSHTPAEAVIEALDALARSIENGEGMRVSSAGRKSRFYIKIIGLPKGAAFRAEAVIELINNAKSEILQQKPVENAQTRYTVNGTLPGIEKKIPVPSYQKPPFDIEDLTDNLDAVISDAQDAIESFNDFWEPGEKIPASDLEEQAANERLVALEPQLRELIDKASKSEHGFDVSEISPEQFEALKTVIESLRISRRDRENYLSYLEYQHQKAVFIIPESYEVMAPEERMTIAQKQQAILTPISKKTINGKEVDFVVIPCGDAKLDVRSRAVDMYTGAMFKDALATARGIVPDHRIFILSAKHGLMTLDQMIDPYDVKLGQTGSIEWNDVFMQGRELFTPDSNVLSLLPAKYHDLLAATKSKRGINFNLDRAFEGTKGIGEQKGRLKAIREDVAKQGNLTPVEVVQTQVHPGSVKLTEELEGIAVQAASDPTILKDLRDEHENLAMLESDIHAIENPTPEELALYRDSKAAGHKESIDAVAGIAETLLGAKWDQKTGKITWNLTPRKGAPEWEWWYRLGAKERQSIARDFFESDTAFNPAAKGPRLVRVGGAIDKLASSVEMDVETFADSMLDTIRQIQKLRSEARDILNVDPADLRDEYIYENSAQLHNERESLGSTTVEEYEQIIQRAEYLAGDQVSAGIQPLRPLPDTPELVQFERNLYNPDVRNAAYDVDVVDAMAKDAAKKMRQAQRMSERIAAFQEFMDKSKQFDETVQKMWEKQQAHENLRLKMYRNEQRQAEQRRKEEIQKKGLRMVNKIIKSIETNPETDMIGKLKGNLPLEIAMQGGYPGEVVSYEIPTEEGGVEVFNPVGPMYLPTGKFEPSSGGVQTEVTVKGLDGFNKSTSEHYRDGDRHTIFSLRLVAKRLGNDVYRWTMNDRFQALVSQFGQKVQDIIGEERAQQLYQQAYDRASNLSEQEQIRIKGLNDAEISYVNGTGAYAEGLPNPKREFDLAVKRLYGELIVREMAMRGLAPIDPYRGITVSMRLVNITEQSIFVPNKFRELIMKNEEALKVTEAAKWLQWFGKVTSFFKTTTLVLSHTWQLGDAITNMIIAQMTGVDVPTMLKRMNEVRLAEYGPGREGLKNMFDPRRPMPTPSDVGTLAQEAPVQDISMSVGSRRKLEGLPEIQEKTPLLNRVTGALGREISYPEWGQGRSVAKVSFKLNETINRIQRHAYFLELLDRKLTERGTSLDAVASDGSWRTDPEIKSLMYDVADTANKWLGDFSDLTMAERKYVTPFVPFYAWIKHIHKVFVALGMEHPDSLKWYIYIGGINYNPDEDPMGLRYGGMSFLGGTVSVNFLNPLADVINGPIGAYLLEGDTRPLKNVVGPVPRLASGLLLGEDFVKGGALARPPGTGNYTASGQQASTPLLRAGHLQEAAAFTIQQFPLLQRIQNILPGKNIPGTSISLGPVQRYPTGQARISPITGKRITKWGGELGSIARLFSIPGVPGQTDQQVADIQMAALARLRTIQTLKYRNAHSPKP